MNVVAALLLTISAIRGCWNCPGEGGISFVFGVLGRACRGLFWEDDCEVEVVSEVGPEDGLRATAVEDIESFSCGIVDGCRMLS